MTITHSVERPIRAGVFAKIERADCAIEGLLKAGFTPAEISVVCSNEVVEEHFKPFEHEKPAGTNMPLAATAGGAIGATVFGLTVVGAGIATGGVALIAAGGGAMWFGGMVGGFIGAMLTRGFEREAANYYDQAVSEGKILVTVEDQGPNAARRLAAAEEVFAGCGTEPLPLSHG
ncbi:MAG: hypothetical protein AB7O62_18430 [Pirellulales bacterium]